MESLDGGTCSFGVDMSASPSLIGETSPSAPSALSASPEAEPMHAELLRLREEVAHLRRRLATQPAHESQEDGRRAEAN